MIRLARVGAKKQPYYRIVVIEKDRARNGRSIEVIGTYNPRTSPASVELKHERVAYWRGVGAQLSPTVAKLVANAQSRPPLPLLLRNRPLPRLPTPPQPDSSPRIRRISGPRVAPQSTFAHGICYGSQLSQIQLLTEFLSG